MPDSLNKPPQDTFRFALLEPLRGCAALWVFCFHYEFSQSFREALPGLYSVFRLGHLGIPMFFVISGFCITAAARSAIRSRLHWSRFLFRRVKRIYPPYWLSILVVIAIPFVIEAISSLKSGVFHPPSGTSLNYGFLNYRWTDWLKVASLTKVFETVPDAPDLQFKFTTINAVYWTLAIEAQFYLVVTAALWVPTRFYQAMGAVTVASLVTATYFPGSFNSGIYLPYWPMFALGIVLYWLVEHGIRAELVFGRYRMLVAASGIVAMLLCLLWVAQMQIQIHYQASSGLFFAFLFLIHGIDDTFESRMKDPRNRLIGAFGNVVTGLGIMSFSLYLLHGRLQFLAVQAVRQIVSENSIGFDISVIALTCGLCFFFHLSCERPFITRKSVCPPKCLH
jgi:peptidoglycan/LPS O-acetylase OafA/YrhL